MVFLLGTNVCEDDMADIEYSAPPIDAPCTDANSPTSHEDDELLCDQDKLLVLECNQYHGFLRRMRPLVACPCFSQAHPTGVSPLISMDLE